MINLFTNNCLGAFTYQEMKMEYNNPFMWSVVSIDDMVKLLNNYQNLDWFNIKCEKTTEKIKGWNNSYNILVDNCFRIYYIHYKYNEKCLTLTKHKNSVNKEYVHMGEYTTETYLRRVHRMIESKVPPMVYVSQSGNEGWTESNLTALLSKYSPRALPICVIGTKGLCKYNKDNVFVYPQGPGKSIQDIAHQHLPNVVNAYNTFYNKESKS
jgi:hypothetical protein